MGAPYEQVELYKSTSCPHLNGVQGQIISRYTDENGFMVVRMPKWARTNAAQGIKCEVDSTQPNPFHDIKVRPHRLKPIRHPSDIRPRGGVLATFQRPAIEEGVSVKSLSVP